VGGSSGSAGTTGSGGTSGDQGGSTGSAGSGGASGGSGGSSGGQTGSAGSGGSSGTDAGLNDVGTDVPAIINDGALDDGGASIDDGGQTVLDAEAEQAVETGPDVALDAAVNAADATVLLDGSAVGCIGQIKSNGYAFTGVAACSACNDNGNPKIDECKGMIDCLALVWPCAAGENCWTNCRNSVGGSSVVETCVSNLTNAACN
jgi:hypothetical protein